MTTFDLTAALLSITALLAYVNLRTLRLPPPIAMMLAGLFGAVVLTIADKALPNLEIAGHILRVLANVNFSSLLLKGMLGFLLFAGSLTVNFHDLRESFGTVITLASVGVILSTVIVGSGTFTSSSS